VPSLRRARSAGATPSPSTTSARPSSSSARRTSRSCRSSPTPSRARSCCSAWRSSRSGSAAPTCRRSSWPPGAYCPTESFFKEVARGGEQTRVLSISFIFSFSPLYRWATAAPLSYQKLQILVYRYL
jgi:hypothetical protein